MHFFCFYSLAPTITSSFWKVNHCISLWPFLLCWLVLLLKRYIPFHQREDKPAALWWFHAVKWCLSHSPELKKTCLFFFILQGGNHSQSRKSHSPLLISQFCVICSPYVNLAFQKKWQDWERKRGHCHFKNSLSWPLFKQNPASVVLLRYFKFHPWVDWWFPLYFASMTFLLLFSSAGFCLKLVINCSIKWHVCL